MYYAPQKVQISQKLALSTVQMIIFAEILQTYGKVTNKFRCNVTFHTYYISSIYVRPHQLE